ncbi:hypothetical protein N0V91_001485 [Didymella pomorum]|uniref:Uncharacterized protein n=1 Tax=Didymella pomorum TaxID=749634 RepID=A0A9W9DC30_9PLEO|nr:hypothetical protein N0V91_001485 [Didymella pomorum]
MSFFDFADLPRSHFTLDSSLVNPHAKIVKATLEGKLVGAAGFLTHEALGLQWTSLERKAWAGSAEKELEFDQRLE